MKKLIIIFMLIFIASGCAKEKIQVQAKGEAVIGVEAGN